MSSSKFYIKYLALIVLLLSGYSAHAAVTWKTAYPSPTGNSIQGITWTGSHYLGVTLGGVIFKSTDLSSYSASTVSSRDLYAVADNGSQSVAVGDSGTVLVSSDGVNWISYDSKTTKPLKVITWIGSRWIAAGASGVITTSTDGINWSLSSSGTTSEITSLAWSGSLLLATTSSKQQSGQVLSSMDGVNWTQATTLNISSIIWDGNRFVGLNSPYGNGRNTTVSLDGISWTDQANLPSLGVSGYAQSLYWNGNEYLALGKSSFSRSEIYTGSSLGSWKASLTSEVNDFASKGGTHWLAAQHEGRLAETQDNVSWVQKATAGADLQHLNDVVFANNLFVAVGNAGTVFTSTDGHNWTGQTSGTTEDLRAVTWSGSEYITVAEGTSGNAVVLISQDAVTWTNLNASFRQPVTSVAANSSTILVGFSGSVSGGIYSSTDGGVSWSQVFSNRVSDIVWNGSLFVATGQQGFASSVDGVTWTGVQSLTYKANRIYWNGTEFSGVGGDKIFSSADGVSWAYRKNSKLPVTFNDIISVNGIYLVVGEGNGQIYRSTWETFQASFVGNLGTVASPVSVTEEVSGHGDSGRIKNSTNGTGWGLKALASDGSVVVAVGTVAGIVTRSAPSAAVFTPCSAGTGFGAVNVTGTAATRVRDCYIPKSGGGSSTSIQWSADNVAPVGLATPDWTLSIQPTTLLMSAGLDSWSAFSLSGYGGFGITVDDVNNTVTFDQTSLSGSGGTIILEGTMSYSTLDQVAPVITLNGSVTVTLTVGDNYTDAGATANDNIDGDLTSSIVVDNPVDTAAAGTYIVRYSVSDSSGNSAQLTRTVTVAAPAGGGGNADTVAPVITLIGDANVTLEQGAAYTEPGATASDDVDGDISAQISVSGTVDTSAAGTYILHYNVSDAAGNAADEVSRTVTVTASSSGNNTSSESGSGGGGSLERLYLLWLSLLLLQRIYLRKKLS